MTGFVIGAYRDRVEIVSDGAVYLPDGTVLGSDCKVLTSDCVPLALIGSGATADIGALASVVLQAAEATLSVDETLTILAGALAKIGKDPNGDTGLRMAIGAISETEGPVAYVFSTFNEPDSSAFELRRMRSVFAQGATPRPDDLAEYGSLSLAAGLEKDAVFMMESMRRQRLTNPASPDRDPRHTIGGHVDFTVIRADGYEQRRLHIWPDKIGSKIDPFAGRPAV